MPKKIKYYDRVVVVKLPSELLQQLDIFAHNERKSRSEVVREAIIAYIQRKYFTYTRDI